MSSYIVCDSAAVKKCALSMIERLNNAKRQSIMTECTWFVERVHNRLWNRIFDPYMALTAEDVYGHVFLGKTLSRSIFGLDEFTRWTFINEQFLFGLQYKSCYRLLKLAECSTTVHVSGEDAEAIGLWPPHKSPAGDQ